MTQPGRALGAERSLGVPQHRHHGHPQHRQVQHLSPLQTPSAVNRSHFDSFFGNKRGSLDHIGITDITDSRKTFSPLWKRVLCRCSGARSNTTEEQKCKLRQYWGSGLGFHEGLSRVWACQSFAPASAPSGARECSPCRVPAAAAAESAGCRPASQVRHPVVSAARGIGQGQCV